jgi:hypothetical protein
MQEYNLIFIFSDLLYLNDKLDKNYIQAKLELKQTDLSMISNNGMD